MESEEVYGANDPHVSSRDKDRLFADEPRKDVDEMDDGDRALAEHRAAVRNSGESDTDNLVDSASRASAHAGPQPAEGMLAQPVPDRHTHTVDVLSFGFTQQQSRSFVHLDHRV